MRVNWGFQHVTDTDVAMKQKGKKMVGRMRVKEKDKVVNVSVTAWHYSELTLLDYKGQ
jgi:hypothetical protein